MIPATYVGVRSVSRTTGSPVVASSCDPADGRQKRRRVAPEASDGPILPPIGGNAKQAGFAERRYGDQLHGSDRGLRCTFVSIHLLDGKVSFIWLTSTLIHSGADICAVVPREAHSRRGPRTSQTASSGVRPRAAFRSLHPMRSLRCASTVPARPPSHRPTNSPTQRLPSNLPRNSFSGRGTLSFR